MGDPKPWERLKPYLEDYGALPILSSGFLLGWLIGFLIEGPIESSDTGLFLWSPRVATQFLLFTLTWLAWAWGVMGKGKELYLSGRGTASKSTLKRYFQVFGGGFIFFHDCLLIFRQVHPPTFFVDGIHGYIVVNIFI